MMNLLAGLLLGGIAFALSSRCRAGWAPSLRYVRIPPATSASTPSPARNDGADAVFGSILRCTGDARTPEPALNALTCPLDVLFNFLLIYPTRTVRLGGGSATLWGAGLGVRGAALGTSIATVLVALAMLGCLLLREGRCASLGRASGALHAPAC